MTLEDAEKERAQRPAPRVGMKSQNCHKHSHRAMDCDYDNCICDCHIGELAQERYIRLHPR